MKNIKIIATAFTLGLLLLFVKASSLNGAQLSAKEVVISTSKEVNDKLVLKGSDKEWG